jgi:hypothetical protein
VLRTKSLRKLLISVGPGFFSFMVSLIIAVL